MWEDQEICEGFGWGLGTLTLSLPCMWEGSGIEIEEANLILISLGTLTPCLGEEVNKSRDFNPFLTMVTMHVGRIWGGG